VVAAFLTTEPPNDIVDWRIQATFLAIGFILTLAIISVTAGTCLLYLLGDTRASALRTDIHVRAASNSQRCVVADL